MSVPEGVALSVCCWAPMFVAGSAVSLSRRMDILSGSALAGILVPGAAAAATAMFAVAQLSLLPAEFFLVLAPPWIGAAPWLAGEMLCGPTALHDESFAAAVVAAYGGCLVATCCGSPLPVEALVTAAAATLAYLCVRAGARAARGEGDARG